MAERLAAGEDPDTALALAFVDAEGELGAEAWPDASTEERQLFARAWLSLALDNERLAPELQLTATELVAPRRLLASFFFGSPTIQSEAQDVLRFIEGRFASGHHAQARLLLQLFETDAATWRNNERNLAHEETTLALTATRRSAVTADMRTEFDLVASQAVASGVEGLRMLAAWYAARADVRLHVQSRDIDEMTRWGEALADADRGARDFVLDSVPPWCWRPIDLLDGDLADRLVAHAAFIGADRAVRHLARAMYFVVLMPGRTGLEPLIVEWVRWGGEAFEDPITRVLPDLHRRTVVLEQRVELALDAVCEAWMSRHGFDEVFERDAVEAAAHRVVERLTSIDPAMVPEGDYDVGGLVLDELIGFRPRRATDSLRLHRLT